MPDPWQFMMRELPDVVLVRARIAEPGRYYHRQRAIVLRRGLLLEEERRYLWHELVHALRGDEQCDAWANWKMELSVEREAARRAMPVEVLEDAIAASVNWYDFVGRTKVPEEWVRFRIETAHPAEKGAVEAARRWQESA
ncbi:MAG: hypothetical protein IE926_11055 [Micrococcales bacterium]|nr:hypothetical protein [Micrococcales bacterium]